MLPNAAHTAISRQRAGDVPPRIFCPMNPCPFNTLTPVFAKYYTKNSQEEENRIKKIPLKDFYQLSSDRKTMRCLICELDIDEDNRFKHTVTSQHVCNKALYNFVQKRFQNGDDDFIVLNAKWLECRYCSGVKISRHSDSESYSHAQFNHRHIMLKIYCWSNINLGSNPRTTENHARQVQNTFPETMTMGEITGDILIRRTLEARSTGLIQKQRNTITVPKSHNTSSASSVITNSLVSTANDRNFNQQVRQESQMLSWANIKIIGAQILQHFFGMPN